MPLSARSPDGPISLVGMDSRTIENLKARNRVEKIFTAKCCGAPVQIRTSPNKVPHFYHTTSNPKCDGNSRESAAHLQLKHDIASAAIQAGWTVEVEAAKRRADGSLEWKADVLAVKGTVKVAFEVQISNQDWTTMQERQQRYLEDGVRGLWFVRTKKLMPLSKELPIFRLSDGADEYEIHLAYHDDWIGVWWERDDKVVLSRFVIGALQKQLSWAPFARTWQELICTTRILSHNLGTCLNCGCVVAHPYALSMDIDSAAYYPGFVWHQGMNGKKRTFWKSLIFSLVQKQQKKPFAISDSLSNSCSKCGASTRRLGDASHTGDIDATIQLEGLPAPRPGTIEWDWLNRWVFKPD